MISHQLLQEILSYDPDTGLLVWIKPRPKIRVGEVAGSIGKHKRGKFRARIVKNKKHIHLGEFNNLEDAAAAYNAAVSNIHGEFARAS